MSKYIDAEMAKKVIADYGHGAIEDGQDHLDCVDDIVALKNAMDWIPAADVVPVVHCCDCKHFNHERMECENEAVSTDHEGGAQYSLNFRLDDFCSYGERKDGGADNA